MQVARFFNTYEPVSTIVRDLAPALQQVGLTMELVFSSAVYRGGRGGLEDCLRAAGGRVVRVPSVTADPGTGFGKLGVVVSYAIGAAFYSLFARRAAVNVFLTQPPLFFAWGRMLRLFRRQPYVIILMDMYPDAALAHGSIKPGGPFHRLGRWMAGIGLRAAQRVYVIGRCMGERVLDYGVDEKIIRYIPNWADETRIFPVKREDNPLAAELGLTDEFVVLYSGNMGVGHQFEDLLEVARRLKNDDRIRFVFFGGGARRGEIEQYCQRHQLTNVILRDFVAATRMSESQSLGDVHFVSLREEFEGIMVPSKVYGALAAGRPVIYHGGPRSEIGRMIREEGIGAVVSSGEVDRLEEVLIEYLVGPDRLRRQGERARDLAERRYSRNAAISAYVADLESVVQQNRAR